MATGVWQYLQVVTDWNWNKKKMKLFVEWPALKLLVIRLVISISSPFEDEKT